MKQKNVGWVEQSETQQNQGFFVLGFAPQTPPARLVGKPQGRNGFIKVYKNKGSWFLFNESNKRALEAQA